MAGFVDFEITWRANVFSGAPQASSAANFGTLGINFRARKPRVEAEWATALAALNCEVPFVGGDEAPRGDNTRLNLGRRRLYDAGDLGCAYGPLNEIAGLMHGLSPGQTVEVRAMDPSVAVDLPAWCRLTGHELVTRQGDRYLIRRVG
ncbi:MAG: sulfurtransferase TusA family protein [Anaerolineales bacterium]|nr:sulfurtransferase TusA family protein [Anaerolineales bacterium]